MLKNMNIIIKHTRETPAIYPFQRQLLCYDLLGFLEQYICVQIL
jgi:hypothetical protein